MKKTDGLTKAIGILLFLAMLCYIGFAVARRVTRSTQTALAAETTLTLSADMTGLVIRSEQPVVSDRAYIDVTAADGQRLAAGEAIATVYGTPQALDRAVELRVLSQEIDSSKRRSRSARSRSRARSIPRSAGWPRRCRAGI